MRRRWNCRAACTLLAATAICLAPGRAHAQQPLDDTTPTAALVEREREGEKDGGAEKDDPTARLEWQRQAWGPVTPEFRRRAIALGRDHAFKKNMVGPRWVSIGPTSADYAQNGSFTGLIRDSGRARTILPHPTDPDIVYFLTSGGGLWKTTNWTSDRTTWTPLNDLLPTTGGGAVAFGRNPNTLYLGLGDPYDQIIVGGSVAKSTNGGVTWSALIELDAAVSVRDLQVDTSTQRDIVLVATDSGLYRSADAGATYAAVPTFAGMSVWSIVRTSAGWLASAQPCPAASVGLRCGQATTLFRSDDRGATWTPISNAGGVFANNGRTTLSVGTPGDAVVYAYANTVTDGALRDVYRSADGGLTWVANGVNATKIPTNPVSDMPNMNICQGQCWYNQMVLVDPRDATRNTLWIGGNLASAQSTDGGVTWTLKTWWLPGQHPLPYSHADFHAAAFKSTGMPTLILGNDGGLSTSTDDGRTFGTEKNDGLVTHLFYTVAGNPRFPNLVIGGTQDNGTRLRTDNGYTYNQVIGGDGMGTAYSQANTNSVLGSAQSSGIRTNLSNTPPDVFQNWVGRGTLSDGAGAGFFTSITAAPAALDATGRVFFHFTNSRVWRTNDGGLNWIRIGSATSPTSPGLPAARRFRSAPSNLGVSPADLNRIAVGAAGGFIDITTDGGATWADINLVALVPGYQGFVSNVTWADNQTLWVTSTAQATGAIRVIKGTVAPGGPWASATWTPLQEGLPDLPVTRVYVDPRDASGNTLYAATHVGVYRTTTGGTLWEPYSNGLPVVRVNDIYMPPDGSFIRIGTYGRGIWELPQIELVTTELTDNGGACDLDGVLDNGEAGFLTVTLKNQGPNNVNQISVQVTSSNPNVTFPNGNRLSFPPLQKYGESTGRIAVALNGASGIESTDFQFAIDAPELAMPSALSYTATHRVNYDDVAGVSAVETVESEKTAWTFTGDPVKLPNITRWQRRALSPTQHVWWGPDNNGQADGEKADQPDQQSLVSPALQVGSDPVTLSFTHRFAFEASAWDGGVIEISTDGGGSWSDIGLAAYNGSTNGVTAAPIGASRRAFVNRSAGWPNFTNVTLPLGTAYAGQTVQIRFRVGADESTGAPGWDIDDIRVTGLTTTPFTGLVPNMAPCPAGSK